MRTNPLDTPSWLPLDTPQHDPALPLEPAS